MAKHGITHTHVYLLFMAKNELCLQAHNHTASRAHTFKNSLNQQEWSLHIVKIPLISLQNSTDILREGDGEGHLLREGYQWNFAMISVLFSKISEHFYMQIHWFHCKIPLISLQNSTDILREGDGEGHHLREGYQWNFAMISVLFFKSGEFLHENALISL